MSTNKMNKTKVTKSVKENKIKKNVSSRKNIDNVENYPNTPTSPTTTSLDMTTNTRSVRSSISPESSCKNNITIRNKKSSEPKNPISPTTINNLNSSDMSFLSGESRVRSLPDLSNIQLNEDITELQQTIADLRTQLESAHNEIENLILEKNKLAAKLTEKEHKVTQLIRICSSPTKSTKKIKTKSNERDRKNTISQNSTKEKTPSDQTIKPNRKPLTSSLNRQLPKMCILSTNNRNNILKIAQDTFRDIYKMCHYCTPHSHTLAMLDDLSSKILNYTMNDFCIILISENDFVTTKNYFNLIIKLRNIIQNVRHTNVILCLPTYRIGRYSNMYNWRVEHFNNLLYLDLLTHEHAYLLDSNKNVVYDYSMFNRKNGTLNDFGYHTIFKDLSNYINECFNNYTNDINSDNNLDNLENFNNYYNNDIDDIEPINQNFKNDNNCNTFFLD